MTSEIKRSCRNCKNPYCTRTMEERQKREVQVHFQYGWECSDKEKYLEHNSGLQLIQWHDLRKDPQDLPKESRNTFYVVLKNGNERLMYWSTGRIKDVVTGEHIPLDFIVRWCEIPEE